MSVLIVVTRQFHGRFSMDTMVGVQKFHEAPTPRIGGVAIYFAAWVAVWWLPAASRNLALMILCAGVPAFGAGFIEDISKNVSPKIRLMATLVSGAIVSIGFGYGSVLAHAQWVNNIVETNFLIVGVVSIFIAFGVAGVANAINIVDGFHGLASGSLIIMETAFCIISFNAGDIVLARLILLFIFVTAGFFVVNYPSGRIFLGDAGAYFCGFALATIAVLVTARNESVSPFVCLLVVFYPVYETLFSMVRKTKREGHSPSQPDSVHMHMLVKRSIGRRLANAIGKPKLSNALTGTVMWLAPLSCSLFAVLTWQSGLMAVCECLLFGIWYDLIYQKVSLQKKKVKMFPIGKVASESEGPRS